MAEPAVANLPVVGQKYEATNSQDGDREDDSELGDETNGTVMNARRFTGGVGEVKVARILQRLLIVVKIKQRKWAWRDYRR